MSIAFFVTLGLLTRALSSRSLAARVALPEAPAARSALLATDLNERPLSHPLAVHIRRQPSTREVATIDAPPEQPARSRNPVSRFVRAMVRASAVIVSGPEAR
jgi:hypothetical protein